MSTTYTLKVKSTDLTIYEKLEASWDENEKLEYDLDVDSSPKTLNFGDIDNIRFFMITTDSDIGVDFTESGNTVSFEVKDLLVFSPTANFIIALSSVEVYSLGGTANVKIRIYGEVA